MGVVHLTCLLDTALTPAIRSSSGQQQLTTPSSHNHLQLASLWLGGNTLRYSFATCKHEVFTREDWYLRCDWGGHCQHILSKSSVSWPQHYWPLEPDNFLWRAVLCTRGWSAVSPAFPHYMPTGTVQPVTIKNVSRHHHICPGEQIAPSWESGSSIHVLLGGSSQDPSAVCV